MTTDAEDKTRLSDSPFDQLLGISLSECSDELVTCSLEVANYLRQPTGVLHGGVFAAIAESLASAGTNVGVYDNGEVGLGMQNDTRFIRPLAGGALTARATRRHRGSSTWVWDVDFVDDRRRLCAISRVTVAVRAAPS